MAATVTDPLLGHLVDGRYEVLSRIARGGMATVYLAVDRRLDRQVALKVMHPHLADGSSGADFVARFRREARAAARLTHPGLVGVYDQGVDGDTSYLTMEYVDGSNLRRDLTEQGALTLDDALATIEAICEALSVAHRSGLVHRDIKPENVLIASDGRIKVADFGLARAVTEVTSTTTGTVLGTVAYLAPELVAHGTSDTRTDVYAAGILLFEMVTGRQPFTGTSPIHVAYQHVHSDVPAPSTLVDWLPTEVDELVTVLASRDPDARPVDAASALALVRRTRAAVDARTLARRAEIERRQDDHDTPDHGPEDAPTTVLATGLPAPVADEDVGRTMALRIGSVQDPAPPPPVTDGSLAAWRRRAALLLAGVAVVALAAIVGIWYATSGPGAYTVVPSDVVGIEVTDARAVLAAAGLGATTSEAHHPEAPAGTVVASDPAPGERVPRDGVVDLVVSLGPDLRNVPDDLEGAALTDVTAALEGAGFVVQVASRSHHDDVAEDHVISLSARAGEELPVDSVVSLTVSDGPAPTAVPSLVGLDQEEASSRLEASGLRIEEAEDYSLDVPEGVVMSQEPRAGAEARRTDTVTITVSQGPPLVELPDVFGEQFNDAQRILEDLGLVVERENFLGGVFGTVRNQDPEAGEQVRVGSTVTLRVV
ncbi:Stk1 family PASTA domain-containing Ser/Thr kinase [Cellulomonas bogoriensis]|uniref:non-specific serine/threonine protein kinase n=1 Tax=Cellulomonas bogoriensis 69B4 = DSM 16987 TaxID=1386082 RepID=A0A0A0BZ02_9CELL|nr:Stk1 family PASTA domain-containing Ser/Thr kinase [Cellulomonas bogoriensis]KGM13170.1 serine/threonine protein kinase [Cellulomonas bogoriensis 69B4 = DSM 16987]